MTTTINNEHKKLNVPNLRFPEFSNEWSKDILQNVVAFSNGKAHENCVDENGCYILVNSKFVSTKGSVIKKVTLQLSPLFKSQFVMVMSDLPNGKALAKCFYIEKDNIYTLNQRICSFTAQNGNVSRFLMYQINRNKYYLRYDDGINQTNLKKGEVLACPVFIPSIQEQTKIATFIHLLDKRIATQTKIIDKLRSLIKGICNNYFEKLSVQEKANLIRLSDVLKERNEYSSKDGKFIHGTLSKDGIFPKTGRWDRDFLVKQEDKKYKVTHLDDICYNPANLKFGVICRNTFGDLIFSPIYVTFEVCKNVNIGFMELYLTNHNFIEKVRRFEQGTVYERMAVSPEDFLSYKIRIPSYPDQTFFYKKVQWLITLSQNEMKLLSQYKKLRQYLLRQMFI